MHVWMYHKLWARRRAVSTGTAAVLVFRALGRTLGVGPLARVGRRLMGVGGGDKRSFASMRKDNAVLVFWASDRLLRLSGVGPLA